MTAHQFLTHQRRRRAFMLVVALAVLVLLSMLGLGAMSLVRVNQTFLVARIDSRRLSSLLSEAAHSVAAAPAHKSGSAPFEIATVKLAGQDVQVSATLLSAEQGTPLLGTALKLRSGDQVFEFTATQLNNPSRSRGAVYLINANRLRSGPILLMERRS